MSKPKAIATSLVALMLLCVVAETADAGHRRRCRKQHRRANHCCQQTCCTPAPTCGCDMSGHESACGCQASGYESSNYDSQGAGPDAAPMPPSNDNYDNSNQNSDPESGVYSEQGGAQTDRETRNNPVPPAPPAAPNN
jgi:hypothetical protein